MTLREAMDFLNDAPYYYQTIGVGVDLQFDIGNNMKVHVKRNKIKGGMDVSCNGDVFHFVFDFKNHKWANSAPKMASTS